MASFLHLSDSEIRSKLAEYGHPVGPVTETTRKILIKKLELLTKNKKSTSSSRRSLSRYSSGEESESEQNGGTTSRRVSMPPPSSFKSTRRKTNTRFSTPEFSPVPSTKKYSSEHLPASSSTGVGLSSFISSTPTGGTRSRLSTSYMKFTDANSSARDGSSNSSHNNSLSSRVGWNNSSQNHYRPDLSRRSGPTYETMSSYRARLSNASSSFDSQKSFDGTDSFSKDILKKETRPFFSSFTRGLTRNLAPQDMKESDSDDSGGREHRSSDGFSTAFRKYHSFRNTRDERPSWWHSLYKQLSSCRLMQGWNTWQVLSMSFLVIFVVFFTWLMVAYFYKVTLRPALSGSSTRSNMYPICDSNNTEDQPNVNCVPREQLQLAVQLYKDVYQTLHAKAVRSLCGPLLDDGTEETSHMSERQLIQLLLRTMSNPDIWKLEQGLQNLKILLLFNPHWGISLVKGSADGELVVNCDVAPGKLATVRDVSDGDVLLVLPCPALSWYCQLTRLLYKFVYAVCLICAVLAGVFVLVTLVKYCLQQRQQETQQVMDLVELILQHVSDKSEAYRTAKMNNSLQVEQMHDYVALRHVHDTLILPSQRQAMSSIWQQAVKFIEDNESRIRTEIQQVYGEDATVWRWLGPSLARPQVPLQTTPPPMPPPVTTTPSYQPAPPDSNLYPDLSEMKTESVRRETRRVWQGEAFETGEGSMNCMSSSPTECLKIRHMFQSNNSDYDPDWMVKVKDAIVEKCEVAKILHLSVDKESKEGCVYVKCASQRDAGLAYRQLHGSWFDGALVTVRYLRLERYHERFPDSVNARLPLRPSNNLRLSLQGPAAQPINTN